MAIAILMPALSPTMTEGNVAKWLKKEGDKVEPGQVMVEIETDKAIMEMEAVDHGVIGKILVKGGASRVKVNELIAVLLEEGDDESAIEGVIKKYQGPAGENISTADKNSKGTASAAPLTSKDKEQVIQDKTGEKRIFISPLAKRMAQQNSICLDYLKGSGPNGRIIKRDILQYLESTNREKAVSLLPAVQSASREEFSLKPLSGTRETIAKRLLESKQTIPHFYLSIDCNVDALLRLRSEINDCAPTKGEKPEYKVSINDLVIKAVAKSLRQVPEANSSWSDEGIIEYHNVDIAVAVATDGGLITPIVRSADLKALSYISNEIKSLAERARASRLKPEEYQGGGFCVSNLGMYGIKNFSAIINPPQSCILAVGAVFKQPIVCEDEDSIKVGSVISLTLSCDHRVIDGAKAAEFLVVFKKLIENPMLLLV